MAYLRQTKRSASIRLAPAGAPASPVEGQLYFNSVTKVAYVYASGFFNQMNAQFLGSGGVMSTFDDDGTDMILHTFLSSGIFLASVGAVDILVVAGGGSGGSQYGGGGGAGGLIYKPDHSVTASVYNIVVGAGGAPSVIGTHGDAQIGGDSTVTISGGSAEFTAKGGGGGNSQTIRADDGGSGGGNGYAGPTGAFGAGIQPSQSGDSGTYGFGNQGGELIGAPNYNPGGGGGAGGNGGNGVAATGGVGGVGKNYGSVFGTTFGEGGWFASGGGGGFSTNGAGGSGTTSAGGGGAGADTLNENGIDGQPGTGGGGGGAGMLGDLGSFSGIGGSGVVIIRYPV